MNNAGRALWLAAALALGCSTRGLGDLARDFPPEVERTTDGATTEVTAVTPPGQLDGGGESDAGPPPPDGSGPVAETAAPDGPPASADASDARAPAEVAPLGTVVLVINGEPLDPDDAAIAQRLGQRGLRVQICDDDLAASCDLAEATLVLVSATSTSGKVGTTFRMLAKPVVVSDAPLFDDMALVADDLSVSPNQHGNDTATSLDMASGPRALTTGLAGTIAIATSPVTLNWGAPPDSALIAARVPGRPERAALFAYPAGAQMPGLVAPARRVGLFAGAGAAASFTAEGWALFDAAITWAMQ